MRGSRAVYRVLLLAYPRAFRRRFGAEMEQVFSDRCRAVMKSSGTAGMARFWLHMLADLAIAAGRERTACAEPRLAASAPFCILIDDPPRNGALLAGSVATLVLFAAVALGMRSNTPRRWLFTPSARAEHAHLFAWPRLESPGAGGNATAGNAAARGDTPQALLSWFDVVDVVVLSEADSARATQLINDPNFPRKVRFVAVSTDSALYDRQVRNVNQQMPGRLRLRIIPANPNSVGNVLAQGYKTLVICNAEQAMLLDLRFWGRVYRSTD
jgi:hypothetical protein